METVEQPLLPDQHSVLDNEKDLRSYFPSHESRVPSQESTRKKVTRWLADKWISVTALLILLYLAIIVPTILMTIVHPPYCQLRTLTPAFLGSSPSSSCEKH